MNRALEVGRANEPGGVKRPPFHFDYIEVNDGTKNAHAFQYEDFSFIAVTLPLIELLWTLSEKLTASPLVLQLLQLSSREVRPDALRALLFQFQLSFLVSHEYTHDVHQHCERDKSGMAGVWTEFVESEIAGGMESQAQELDADGYAIFLALAHYVRGAGRQSLLKQLGMQDLTTYEGDELLLMCFLLALMAFFCAIWPDDVKVDSIRQLRHPPAPVRIEYARRVAKMWCTQYKSVPESWFSDERFQALFRAGLEAFGGATRQSWDAQVMFLQSEEGTRYDQQLFDHFEVVRKSE